MMEGRLQAAKKNRGLAKDQHEPPFSPKRLGRIGLDAGWRAG